MTLNSDTKLKKLISGFKYYMSNLVNFYTTTQNSENFTSTDSFCPKYIRFELKKYRGVTLWFQKWVEELIELSLKHSKV